MTPIQRLLLFACSATIAGALGATAIFVGFWVAVIAVAGGALLALLATTELQPKGTGGPTTPEELEAAREAAERERPIRESERDLIERRARRAADEAPEA